MSLSSNCMTDNGEWKFSCPEEAGGGRTCSLLVKVIRKMMISISSGRTEGEVVLFMVTELRDNWEQLWAEGCVNWMVGGWMMVMEIKVWPFPYFCPIILDSRLSIFSSWFVLLFAHNNIYRPSCGCVCAWVSEWGWKKTGSCEGGLFM